MKPLLEIRSVPISIEYKVNNAKVERVNAKVDLEMTRDKRGLTMKSRPIKLNVDSFEARNSVVPTTARMNAKQPEEGRMAAYEATARYANEQEMLLDVNIQDPVGAIIEKRLARSTQSNIKFIPDRPVEIDWAPSELSIKYEMDKLNFDWKKDSGDYVFIPANIEVEIKEYPKLVIEYVGEPIYVPLSANPNYDSSGDAMMNEMV